MATLSELIAGTYDYVGRPTQEKLSLGLVLPILLDSINYYTIDLQISSENWLLKSYIYTPTAKDAVLSVTDADYSVPVSVEVRDSGSTSDSDWTFMHMANATDVQALGTDGQRAVAFYGTPARIVWSFDPVSDWAIQAKIWYEPITTAPTAITDSPSLSTAFHTMLKLRTALACIPYAELPNAEQLQGTLLTQLQGWEQKWRMWVNIDRGAGPIQKRDYRGGRGANSKYWVY